MDADVLLGFTLLKLDQLLAVRAVSGAGPTWKDGVMPKPLIVNPCKELCDWRPDGTTRNGRLVFACAGCGSQWDAGEGWTPRNLDGSIASDVQRELEAR